MLPQPMLRFVLADEPGTGKTIMAGLYLTEASWLGIVNRALVVCRSPSRARATRVARDAKQQRLSPRSQRDAC